MEHEMEQVWEKLNNANEAVKAHWSNVDNASAFVVSSAHIVRDADGNPVAFSFMAPRSEKHLRFTLDMDWVRASSQEAVAEWMKQRFRQTLGWR